MEWVSKQSSWFRSQDEVLLPFVGQIIVLVFPPLMPPVFILWVGQISWVSELYSLSLCLCVSHLLPMYYLISSCSLIPPHLVCSIFVSIYLPVSFITGIYIHSAPMPLRESPGWENHRTEGLSHPGTPIPQNRDPPRTLPPTAEKQPMNSEHQRGQPNSESVPGPNKQAMEGLEVAEVVQVGTGTSKVVEQGSGGGGGSISSYYRPTRRGSPRPSTHNHFDINEHLPWMIVLLLLLVLVVIVVCSVKRSSRVLKKGPVQDPSSIIEKAIQKKPSQPPMQVKERWIYYSNGQGESAFSLTSQRMVLLKECEPPLILRLVTNWMKNQHRMLVRCWSITSYQLNVNQGAGTLLCSVDSGGE